MVRIPGRDGIRYFIWAARRFGIVEGTRRGIRYHFIAAVTFAGTRRRFRLWLRRDRRAKRSGYGRIKCAVNRDGDLGLIECPVCSDQNIHHFEDANKLQIKGYGCGLFGCSGGSGHRFRLYTEDGIRQLTDHRDGDCAWPLTAVRDDTGKLHLGITRDAPWWWRRIEIYRDYNQSNGKDGHGHCPYTIVDEEPAQAEAVSAVMTGAIPPE